MINQKTLQKVMLFMVLFYFYSVHVSGQNQEVYLNEALGVSFAYPAAWVVTEFTEDDDGYDAVIVSDNPPYQGQIVQGVAFGVMVTSWADLGFSDINAFIESMSQDTDIVEVSNKIINNIDYIFVTIDKYYKDTFREVYIYEGNDLSYIIIIAYKPEPEINLGEYQEIINNILNSLIIFETK